MDESRDNDFHFARVKLAAEVPEAVRSTDLRAFLEAHELLEQVGAERTLGSRACPTCVPLSQSLAEVGQSGAHRHLLIFSLAGSSVCIELA